MLYDNVTPHQETFVPAAIRNYLIIASIYFVLRMAVWPYTGMIDPVLLIWEAAIGLFSVSLGIAFLMNRLPIRSDDERHSNTKDIF